MKGPVLHSKDWVYVGTSYPWHVFRPTREGVPELRYLSMANYIFDDEPNRRRVYKKLAPDSEYYTGR